jgi:hypothetical protein
VGTCGDGADSGRGAWGKVMAGSDGAVAAEARGGGRDGAVAAEATGAKGVEGESKVLRARGRKER